MVIKTVKPESTYVNGASHSSSSTKSSSPTMSVQMYKISAYFKTLDGSPNAAQRFEAAFREAFHPDFSLESSGSGSLTYEEVVSMVRSLTERGGYANLLQIVDNGDGTATMTIDNHLPGEIGGDVTHQLVWFREGKAVKVRAIEADEDQFGAVIRRILRAAVSWSNQADDIVAEKYTRMIACFDGSPNAYAKAEPLIDEIFNRNLVIEHESHVKMDFDGFKEWASTFSKERNVATMKKLEKTKNGIRVWIGNIVNGVDLGVSEQVGTIENGKIVHWTASPKDKDNFNRLVSSVAAQSEGSMMGNIQRLRDYLAALDGSPNAWEKFQPHIDRVLARDIVWEDEMGGSRYQYDEIVDLIKNHYIPNGCYPVLESVQENAGDGRSLTVVINNHLPGEKGDATRQTLYYGSDDLIHKLVSAHFSGTCERIAALPKTDQ